MLFFSLFFLVRKCRWYYALSQIIVIVVGFFSIMDTVNFMWSFIVFISLEGVF